MNNSRKAKRAKQIAAYYYRKDNFDKALPNYVRAISFKNTKPYFDEQNYHFISYCYFRLGDLDKALLYIKECLHISSGYLGGKRFYGELLLEMGKTKEGNKIIDECNEIEKKIKQIISI